MKFLFLGTGASSGIPVIGCKCNVCKSSDPKNQRLRTSGMIKYGNKNILIDATPDIRYVCLKYGLTHLGAVLLTHPHEDHIGGINDLRPFSFYYHQTIPMYLSEVTAEVLRIRFDYLLDRFSYTRLDQDRGGFSINDLDVKYFTYSQQGLKVNGFRFGKFAYVTDIKEYNDSIFEDLDGVETLVLGAINEKDSKMHFSISEAVAFKQKITSVKVCYLTHLSHEVDHETLSHTLPNGVVLAYDGLEIDV